jgi:hypothetical protein
LSDIDDLPDVELLVRCPHRAIALGIADGARLLTR